MCIKCNEFEKIRGALGTGDWVTGEKLDDGKRRFGFLKRWDIRITCLFKMVSESPRRINLREQ